jgi:hypothetical protein
MRTPPATMLPIELPAMTFRRALSLPAPLFLTLDKRLCWALYGDDGAGNRDPEVDFVVCVKAKGGSGFVGC